VDTARGDVLAVENLSFQELPLEIVTPPTKLEHWRQWLQQWSWILRYVGLAALFGVIYALILRPLKKQALIAFRELPGKLGGADGTTVLSAAGAPIAIKEAGVSPPSEGQRANQLKKLLTEKVKAEPAAAGRLVESWVREEKA
jgi:flagellar M-ring protein FliF